MRFLYLTNAQHLLGVCLLVLLFSGCSQIPLQSDRLLQTPPAVPPVVELERVPFFPQVKYQCGPAALATALVWSGVQVTDVALVPEVYIPERKGSLQVELLAAARKRNVIPYPLEGGMEALLQELAAGHPVLVMQNLGLSWAPQWHYAVVVGYDLNRDQIVLRSGQTERHINSFKLFERTWQRADYWGVVFEQPERLPASISPLQFARSVAPFESLAKYRVAEHAYQAGLAKWPNERTLLMGLANSRYALQLFDEAEQNYRHVVSVWPDYAPGLNNLAYLLYERGRYSEALPYAEAAIAQGGRMVDQYQNTLELIRQAMVASQPKN